MRGRGCAVADVGRRCGVAHVWSPMWGRRCGVVHVGFANVGSPMWGRRCAVSTNLNDAFLVSVLMDVSTLGKFPAIIKQPDF